MNRVFLCLVIGSLVTPSQLRAQLLDLRDMLPSIVSEGVQLAQPESETATSHQAHFTAEDSPQILAMQQVSSAISRQISSYPLSSSAGGFSYRLDPTLGVLSRPTRSFGPIYAERPITLGKGRFNAGLNFSRFTFDDLDEISLRDGELNLVFTHVDGNHDGLDTPAFEGDLVTADLFVRAETDIRTLVASYGVTERMDIAIAVPMVEVKLDIALAATIQRLATAEGSRIHEFEGQQKSKTIRDGGEARGVGDVVVRGKYLLVERNNAFLGVAADFRLPTGDARDLLGTGSGQIKGALLGFLNRYPVAPHVNLGYASNAGGLPDEILYTAGFDWVVDPKLTVAVDVLGRNVDSIDEVRVEEQQYVFNTTLNPNNPPVFDSATFPFTTREDIGRRNFVSGSVGFKLNFLQNILLTANALVPITEEGLRDDFASLFGFDYSF